MRVRTAIFVCKGYKSRCRLEGRLRDNKTESVLERSYNVITQSRRVVEDAAKFSLHLREVVAANDATLLKFEQRHPPQKRYKLKQL